jgi:hypothetical protein
MTDAAVVEQVARALIRARIQRRAPGYGHLPPNYDAPFEGDIADAEAVLASLPNQGEAEILRSAERAQIVAWLEDTSFGDDDLDASSIIFAERIERGDHLTAGGEG